MSEQPILSILVPTFNRAHYLKECLDSLLDNTIDCEVLIGDNASEDGTAELVGSYQDKRIRYHRHEENIGPAANYNSLIARARGKYVCLFGDDDKVLPGNFEPKLALLETYPDVALVYSRSHLMDGLGTMYASGNVYGRTSFSYIGGRDEFQELMINCYISWQTLVFRRDVLIEVGDLQNDLNLSASLDWYWLQLLCRGRTTAFINKAMVCIRVHQESYTANQAVPEGEFLTDRLAIWTHWLLEREDPPTLSNLLWERMAAVLNADLNSIHADDTTRQQVFSTFETLKRSYLERMENLALPKLIDAYPFQPECPQWPLEGLKQHSIAYYPDWAGEDWRDVIRFYVESFRANDPITLVIIPDITHDDRIDTAIALIDSELQRIASSDTPDILIVPEVRSDFDLACVYAAVDAVLTYGPAKQENRASQMGKKMVTVLTRQDWMKQTTVKNSAKPS